MGTIETFFKKGPGAKPGVAPPVAKQRQAAAHEQSEGSCCVIDLTDRQGDVGSGDSNPRDQDPPQAGGRAAAEPTSPVSPVVADEDPRGVVDQHTKHRQQQQQQQQQAPAVAAAGGQTAAGQGEQVDLAAMDIDTEAASGGACSPRPLGTAAATAAPPSPVGPHVKAGTAHPDTLPGTSASPAAAAAVGPVGPTDVSTARPSGAGTSSTRQTPAAAAAATPATCSKAEPALLSDGEKQQLVAACEQDVVQLQQELGQVADLAQEVLAAASPSSGAKPKGSSKLQPLCLKQVIAVAVEGQPQGLTALAQALAASLPQLLQQLGQRGLWSAPAPPPAPATGTEAEAAVAGSGEQPQPDPAAAAAAGVVCMEALAAAGQLEVAAVAGLIRDVAARQVYSLTGMDGVEGPYDEVAPTTGMYWAWEVRDLKQLPKPAKQAADKQRKQRKQLLDRWKAAAKFLQLAAHPGRGKTAATALARAAARLHKLQAPVAAAGAGGAAAATPAVKQQAPGSLATPTPAAAAAVVDARVLQPLEQNGIPGTPPEAAAAGAGAGGAAGLPSTASKAEKEAARAAKEEERAAKAAAKEQERLAREAEKAAKEAEKAAKAAAKEAAKAAEKEAKEAERARKAAEAAQKKQAVAAKQRGFSDAKHLHASQNFLKSFFHADKPPAGPTTGSHSQGGTGGGGGGTGGGGLGSLRSASQDFSSGDGVAAAAASADLKRKRELEHLCDELDAQIQHLPKKRRAPEQQQEQEQQEEEAACMEVDGGSSSLQAPAVEELRAAALAAWKRAQQQRAGERSLRGAPPTWARRPCWTPADITARAAAMYGEGADTGSLRCWVRKLIKHHDSVRPAYYGSWRRPSAASGRRPLAQEPGLDYEVMSDEDWEEEPEGEDLSEEDGATEEEGDGEEDEEGFVVNDGYLSEDEGLGLPEEEGQEAGPGEGEGLGLPEEEGQEAGPGAMLADRAGAGSDGAGSTPELLPLLEALERARRCNRPLLLVNDARIAWEPTCAGLDPSALQHLSGTILRSDITVLPPELQQTGTLHAPSPLGAGAAAGSAAGCAAAAAAGGVTQGVGALLGTAAGIAVGCMTASAGAVGDGAAAAAAAAAAASGSSGPGAGRGALPVGKPFPEALLPALAQLVHKQHVKIDVLVASFAEQQLASAGVKLSRAKIKDAIRQIASSENVSRTPLWSVYPEVLAAVAAGAPVPLRAPTPPSPTAAAAAGAAPLQSTSGAVAGSKDAAVPTAAAPVTAAAAAAAAGGGVGGSSVPPLPSAMPDAAAGAAAADVSAGVGPCDMEVEHPAASAQHAAGAQLAAAVAAAGPPLTQARTGAAAPTQPTPAADAPASSKQRQPPGSSKGGLDRWLKRPGDSSAPSSSAKQQQLAAGGSQAPAAAAAAAGSMPRSPAACGAGSKSAGRLLGGAAECAAAATTTLEAAVGAVSAGAQPCVAAAAAGDETHKGVVGGTGTGTGFPVLSQDDQQPPPSLRLPKGLTTPPHRTKAAADSAVDGGGGAAAAGGCSTGALPLLTPPSEAVAGGRSSKRMSPIPFNVDNEDSEDVEMGEAAAEEVPGQQQPAAGAAAAGPVAPRSTAGGGSGAARQLQLSAPDAVPTAAPLANSSPATAAAAGGGGDRAGGAGRDGSGSPSVVPVRAVEAGDSPFGWQQAAGVGRTWVDPPLPCVERQGGEVTLAQDYWQQLCTWVVLVRSPTLEQLEAAFELFDEKLLGLHIGSMPQALVTALTKTLGAEGAPSQLRGAAARCLGNITICLTKLAEQQAQQQQVVVVEGQAPQQLNQAAAAAATPPSAAAGAPGSSGGHTASPSSGQQPRRTSPMARSAPLEVCLAGVCSEPHLLQALLKALSVRSGAASGGAGGGGGGEPKYRLEREAAKTLSALVQVGLPPLFPAPGGSAAAATLDGAAAPPPPPPLLPQDACTAAAQLRTAVASSKAWKSLLLDRLGPSQPLRGPAEAATAASRGGGGGRGAGTAPGDPRVTTWCVYALASLLQDPAAARLLLPAPSSGSVLLVSLLERCPKDNPLVDKYLLALLLQLVELEASGALAKPTTAPAATTSVAAGQGATPAAEDEPAGSSHGKGSSSSSRGSGSVLLPVAEDALKMGQVAQRVRELARLVTHNLVKGKLVGFCNVADRTVPPPVPPYLVKALGLAPHLAAWRLRQHKAAPRVVVPGNLEQLLVGAVEGRDSLAALLTDLTSCPWPDVQAEAVAALEAFGPTLKGG